MDPLEKLKQEEAELEAQMLGNQTPEDPQANEPVDPEVSATEDEGIERTEEELAADEYMMDAITSDGDPQQPEYSEEQVDPEPQPQKPKRTNWKKRFTNYKSSTDATIHSLRKELMDIKASANEVLQENQRLREAKREEQGDLFEGAFTQEDEDTFGTEGLDVVKKAAKVAIERQVKPLQEELRKQNERQGQQARQSLERDKRAAYNEFLGRLGSIVPDYEAINKDKEFLKWLKGADDFSGYPRGNLLRQAEANGDVARVADFFIDYKNSQAAVQQQKVPDAVRKHVTPTGTGGGSTAPRQKTDPGYYRQSDIDKFYSDMLKGRYEGQQAVIDATEAAIEQAYTQGRVLKGQ